MPGPYDWRKRVPADTQNAHLVEFLLDQMGAVTLEPLDILNNPQHTQIDEDRRVALHQMVDEVTPEQRASLFEFARLLVVPWDAV